MLLSNHLNDFQVNGFTVFCAPEIMRLRKDISKALARSCLTALEHEPTIPIAHFRDDPTNIHDLIDFVLLHETERNVSGRLYRVLCATPHFIAAINDPNILKICAQLGLGAPSAGTLPILRIDRPFFDKFNTPAHQDFWFSLLSDNCLTFWFPIGAISPEQGPLEVIPGSHAQGLIPFVETGESNPFRPLEKLPDEKFQTVTIPDDGILIFSQFLIHRSGLNRSNKVRLSVQLRYNDLAHMDQPDASYEVRASDYVMAAQARLLDTTQKSQRN